MSFWHRRLLILAGIVGAFLSVGWAIVYHPVILTAAMTLGLVSTVVVGLLLTVEMILDE